VPSCPEHTPLWQRAQQAAVAHGAKPSLFGRLRRLASPAAKAVAEVFLNHSPPLMFPNNGVKMPHVSGYADDERYRQWPQEHECL